MNTLGYVFILVAALIIRGVTKGRGLTQLPGDLAEMFTALVTSDQKALGAVLARTGDSATPATSTTTSGPAGTTSGTDAGLLAAAHQLATAAGNKYVYGASGPAAYDCSGLVWAAMRTQGFTGPRFTTRNFVSVTKATRTTTPGVGDVVLWAEHMGIVDGPGTMFSALNSRYGILHSPISWGGSSAPTYWQVGAKSSRDPGTKTAQRP